MINRWFLCYRQVFHNSEHGDGLVVLEWDGPKLREFWLRKLPTPQIFPASDFFALRH